MKTLIETTVDTQNENTTYWYLIDGESYGLCINTDGISQLLDSEGCPIDECNDHGNIKTMLLMNEPSVDLKSRDSLITWLVWNDRNGCYTDADCDSEGMEKISYSAAMQLYLSQNDG